jgi:hypothetical protein
MFNDIRFVAAMHTLAVVVAMLVGAAAVAGNNFDQVPSPTIPSAVSPDLV